MLQQNAERNCFYKVFFIGIIGLLAVFVQAKISLAALFQPPSDFTDALLLYDAGNPYYPDANFKKVAEYYGLRWASVDLASTQLTDDLLRDEAGQYYPTIGIVAANLAVYLDSDEVAILETAIDQHNVNLLVMRERSYYDHSNLDELTDGEVTGVMYPTDTRRDYLISTSQPDILRELSGLTLAGSNNQYDRALTIAPDASHTEVLVQATDDYSQTYPVFLRFQDGVGSVFVDGGYYFYSLESTQFYQLYEAWPRDGSFEQAYFMDVVPLMAFIRYTSADEAWHNNHNYANLTIDDPCLQEPFKNLNYANLLSHMEAHNYHTTIATVPGRCYNQAEQGVVDIFLNHPDRYSLIMHGNNHAPCPEFRDDIPLNEQRADLQEAVQRMESQQATTGIPYGKIMVFPCKLAGEATLPLLKEHNFITTINSQNTPLSGTTSTAWDFEMYPAIMDYQNYAIISRHWQSTSPYPFDLFRDKPVFIYGHEWDFADNIGAYDNIADAINGLAGNVEWHSQDYIAKRLYLEKRADNGDIDVKWYTNHLILENETGSSQLYHLQKEENGQVYIQSLTVNGAPHSYTVSGGLLQLDTVIDAASTAEIIITYGPMPFNTYLPVILKPLEDTRYSSTGNKPLSKPSVLRADNAFSHTVYLPVIHSSSNVLWQEDFETITKPPAPNCNGAASFYETQSNLFLPFSKPDPGFVCLPDNCPDFGYIEAGNHQICSDYAKILLRNNPSQAQSGNQYLELNVNINGGDGSNYARRIEMRKAGWGTDGQGTWNIGSNEIWRSAWFYLSPDLDNSWIELSDISEHRDDIPYEKYNQIVLYADRTLYIGQQFNGQKYNGKTSTKKVPLGQWVHLEEHFVRSATNGLVEVYLDGELWLANYNIRTMYDPNTSHRGTELSYKLYSAPGTPQKTIYWDNIVFSKTRYTGN